MDESHVLTTGDGDLDEPGAYHRLLHQGLGFWEPDLPFGKLLHNYGKSSFLMDKSTIFMAMFNSKLLSYQMVMVIKRWFNIVIVEWGKMPIGKIWAGDFRSFSRGAPFDFIHWNHGSTPERNGMEAPDQVNIIHMFYGMVLHIAGMFNRTINLRTCFVFIVVCYLVLFIHCVPRCSDRFWSNVLWSPHSPSIPLDPLWPYGSPSVPPGAWLRAPWTHQLQWCRVQSGLPALHPSGHSIGRSGQLRLLAGHQRTCPSWINSRIWW